MSFKSIAYLNYLIIITHFRLKIYYINFSIWIKLKKGDVMTCDAQEAVRYYTDTSVQ